MAPFPLPLNVDFPSINALLEMSKVDAATPAASTCEPLPKVTPFWFTKMTWPFALIAPSMTDAFAPVTRFKITAF